VDEREAREREMLAEFLEGTPVEGDEAALDQLMESDFRERTAAVTLIACGEADSVDAALEDYRGRRDFLRDVEEDLDNL
jgi:hypothetical protein